MWKNIDKQMGGIVGVLTIREISKETGEVLNEFQEKNVITLSGMSWMWKRLALRDQGEDFTFDHFVFGDDYGLEEGGDWTIFLPRRADRSYTKNNQFPVYNDFPENMVFSYPDDNTLQVGTLIDGKYVLDTLYPNQVDIRYNSATIRFKNGEVFSYKRFPVRTISRLVDIQVIWTFTLVDSALYDCSIVEPEEDIPPPDHNFGITTYAGFWGDNTVHKISPMGETVWVYDKHTDWVNALAIDSNYVYSVSRDKSIHIIDITNGVDQQIIFDAHTDIINRVMVDGRYIITTSNDGSTKKWDRDAGTLVWTFNPFTNEFAMDACMHPDGNYYVAYRNGLIYKLDRVDGLEMARWDIGAELVKMEIDKNGDLYLSILDEEPNGYGYAVHKFDPNMNVIRYTLLDFTGYIFGLKVDSDLNLYTGDDQDTVRMFDSVGDEIWRYTRHTDIVRGLDRDQFGYLYSASIDQTVRKVTPNGNQVWAYTGNENAASCVVVNLTPEN